MNNYLQPNARQIIFTRTHVDRILNALRQCMFSLLVSRTPIGTV